MIALYSQKRIGKRMIGKSGIECYYNGNTSHTMINCKTYANDLLKGKLKELANVDIARDPPNINSGEDPTKALAIFAF
jgi:hypothetical protein